MIDVARKHQLKIARQTLKMTEIGARIMGGMTHAEARAVIAATSLRSRVKR